MVDPISGPAHPDDFVPKEPLVLIYVGNSIGSDLSIQYPADVYAAARGYWRMAPSRVNRFTAGYLVLAHNGVRVLGAFRVQTWVHSPSGDGRRGFVGQPAELSAQLDYVGKRVPQWFRNRAPVQYIAPAGEESQ